MKAGNYDITLDQGSTFIFHLTYQNSSGVAIDISSYTAAMQVRRSVIDNDLILDISSGGGVTGGGITGEFSVGGGSASSSSSGITLNGSTVGAAGTTGGLYISIDADTMKNVPAGNHRYDLELNNSGTINKILSGRFEVSGEITR
jgi:hypothetical protein